MNSLVLGGSVFVGKHTVEALLAAGHDVAVLNRGRTPSDLPDAVERLVADRTDIAQMRSALGRREWDAVFDVSGFVMAAGGSDIEDLLDLLDGHVGHYVNVSSIMGLVGYSDISAYNATKGAVRLFTKAIAIEFAQKKMPIRANSLHPGFVLTPLLNAAFQRWVDAGVAEQPQDLVDAMAAQTPMGRLAEPAELASGAFFLAGSDSGFMTGAELVMDGGWTAQ